MSESARCPRSSIKVSRELQRDFDTNARADLTVSGVDDLFASMTAQLALRRRQITMETLRKQRESIYLDPAASSKGKPGSGREGGSGGCC